jgi:prepilin-type N-terminal cleavage/methylation domain-containing protein
MKLKILSSEKGVTLIELLVTISILAVVMAATSMTIITLMRLSPQSKDWAIALRQVQNAGYWISRDVQMSQTIDVDTDPGTPIFLTLTLPQDSDSDNNITIVYQFESIDGEQWLVRTESIRGSIVGQTAIAQYISPDETTANYDDPDDQYGGTLTFTIKATSGNGPVTRDYERDYKAMQRVPP